MAVFGRKICVVATLLELTKNEMEVGTRHDESVTKILEKKTNSFQSLDQVLAFLQKKRICRRES